MSSARSWKSRGHWQGASAPRLSHPPARSNRHETAGGAQGPKGPIQPPTSNLQPSSDVLAARSPPLGAVFLAAKSTDARHTRPRSRRPFEVSVRAPRSAPETRSEQGQRARICSHSSSHMQQRPPAQQRVPRNTTIGRRASRFPA